MVKKFISGILGKKEDESKEGKSTVEEVPDELPPLAEDVIAKTSADAKKEAKSESRATQILEKMPEKEVPEELPPLDEALVQNKIEEVPEAGTIEDLDKENIPDEIKRAKLAKIKTTEEADEVKKPVYEVKAEDNIQKIKDAKDDYTVKERIKAGAEAGFFSNVLEHIKKHGGAKDSMLSGDLFSRMGVYWDLRKHEIKKGAPTTPEKKLEEDLLIKLEELKNLEQKWQVQKLALEEDMKFIHEREREIQSKIEELKLVSNELSLFRDVKPDEYFYMHNGVVLKNLHDLIDVLEVIDEETYNFHVKDGKNDFSDWVANIFKDDKLADKIKNTKARIEIIELLENIPVISNHEKNDAYGVANPKKYFWLANGIVVRNLYELSDSLKIVDDEVFNKHVSDEKNDFAKWVRDVLKNEHLAEKLEKAKTKKEAISILEVFL